MLCDICLELIQQIDRIIPLYESDKIPSYRSLPHHQTVDSVIHAIEVVKCVMCTRAVQEAPGLVDRGLERWSRHQDGRLGLEYNALINLSTWNRNGEISLRLMAADYGGVSAFRLRSFDESILLDLQPVGLNDGLHFRLIESQAIQDIDAEYVTLSHRWGTPGNHPPKLNAASYASLLGGWPIQQLSGTYRDAIEVTKKLGVRYLWIDSLCIFQDEQLDILAEAFNMGTIYGNAVCNISALNARQDGIFSTRDAEAISPRSRVVSKIDLTELQRSYTIGDHRLWEKSVFDAPLSRRGWILQEQLLARRTLFFGHEQLLWSCISGAWCETYPMEDSLWNASDFYLGQRHLEPVRLYCAEANYAVSRDHEQTALNVIDPKLKRDFQMAWRHVVQEYVPRRLTEPSDKLLAITGIMSSFSATQEDECIAGHWKSSFPFNLLWHTSIDGPLKPDSPSDLGDSLPQRPVRQIPTWSWASQDGHLVIPGELDRRYCTPIAKVINIERKSLILARNGIRDEPVGALSLVCPQLPLVRMAEGEDIEWGFEASNTMTPLPSPNPLGENVETYFDVSDSEISAGSLTAAFVSYTIHFSQGKQNAKQSSAELGSSKKTLVRCEGLILQPLPPGQNNKSLKHRRVGAFKFGEITMADSTSRFLPATWRFHLDIEERNNMKYTRSPDFTDHQLMQHFKIV